MFCAATPTRPKPPKIETHRYNPGDEIEAIAAAHFEQREFTPDELAEIKRTRRRSPRIGETRADSRT